MVSGLNIVRKQRASVSFPATPEAFVSSCHKIHPESCCNPKATGLTSKLFQPMGKPHMQNYFL